MHMILLFLLLMIEFAYRRFKRFEDNHTRMLSKYSYHKLVNDVLGLNIIKDNEWFSRDLIIIQYIHLIVNIFFNPQYLKSF